MPSRLARWLGPNVLAPAAIAVLLFVLLEVGCRAAGRVRSGDWPVTAIEKRTRFVREIGRGYRLHPFLSVTGRPGAVIRVAGHEARFNSLGLRGREVTLPKPDGLYRVVCEGGSTTFDLLAVNDSLAWPAQLEGHLGPGTDVVNAGFPGWTSVQSLIALELRDVDLSPDLVVVYSGINDLQPAGHVPFARDYSLGHGEILPRVLGAVEPPLPLVARSVFVEWLRGRLGRLPGPADDGYAPAWDWKGGARSDTVSEAAVAVYARNLRSTVAVARAAGARTLLVVQTARLRAGREQEDRAYLTSWTPGLTAEGYLDGVRRFAAAARGLAGEGAAAVFDPFADGGFDDGDFGDPIHFSPAGSRKFAARMAEEIRRLRETSGPRAAANIRAPSASGPAPIAHD
jgi:lysophospholipase L1-like esterase